MNDQDVDLSNGLTHPQDNLSESSGLIRGKFAGQNAATLRSANKNDIDLFFIEKVMVSNIINETLQGFALPREFLRQVFPLEADLVDSAIIAVEKIPHYSVAHEIGHILTNFYSEATRGHHNVGLLWERKQNLMYPFGATGTSLNPLDNPGLAQPNKRLHGRQQGQINDEADDQQAGVNIADTIQGYIPQ